jgi:hypothetical protein
LADFIPAAGHIAFITVTNLGRLRHVFVFASWTLDWREISGARLVLSDTTLRIDSRFINNTVTKAYQ